MKALSSVLAQESKEAKGTKVRGRGLRTEPGAEGMGAEETRRLGWSVHDRTGRGDTLVVRKDAQTGPQAPDKPKILCCEPRTRSPDPCSGGKRCVILVFLL